MIHYAKYNWYICAYFKVIALVLCPQLGHTKYCCFLCVSDSKDEANHFIKNQWPNRKSYTPGKKNIIQYPFVKPEKVCINW